MQLAALVLTSFKIITKPLSFRHASEAREEEPAVPLPPTDHVQRTLLSVAVKLDLDFDAGFDLAAGFRPATARLQPAGRPDPSKGIIQNVDGGWPILS
jgi:hypothetical protein